MSLNVCLECGQHVFATQHSLIRSIIYRIAQGYGLSYDSVTGPSRQRHVNLARNHAYAALIDCGFTSAEIGRYMGRDHSTVINGAGNHNERISEVRKRAEDQLLIVDLLGPCARGGGDAQPDYTEAFA
jgi:chromosomal replication initiation ATPase DnaA